MVALKVLGGLTLAEVAAVVGCPVGTANHHCSTACARSKHRLPAQGGATMNPNDLPNDPYITSELQIRRRPCKLIGGDC